MRHSDFPGIVVNPCPRWQACSAFFALERKQAHLGLAAHSVDRKAAASRQRGTVRPSVNRRGPPSLPRAELGTNGLTGWDHACLEMSRFPAFWTPGGVPASLNDRS